MVKVLLTLLMLLSSYLGFSQVPKEKEIHSVARIVNDLKNIDGTFYVSFYDCEEAFRTSTPLKVSSLKLKNDSIIAALFEVSDKDLTFEIKLF